MRENSTRSLQLLLCNVGSENPVWIHQFISKHLYPVLKKGLSNKNPDVRVEFVGILRVCTENFQAFAEFKGLNQLLSDDPDIDFFENLRHIQVYFYDLLYSCDNLSIYLNIFLSQNADVELQMFPVSIQTTCSMSDTDILTLYSRISISEHVWGDKQSVQMWRFYCTLPC